MRKEGHRERWPWTSSSQSLRFDLIKRRRLPASSLQQEKWSFSRWSGLNPKHQASPCQGSNLQVVDAIFLSLVLLHTPSFSQAQSSYPSERDHETPISETATWPSLNRSWSGLVHTLLQHFDHWPAMKSKNWHSKLSRDEQSDKSAQYRESNLLSPG